WSRSIKTRFPEAETQEEIWVHAAHAALHLLAQLLRSFSSLHEIIGRMPTTAICMLTVKWPEQGWMPAVDEAMETETVTSQRRVRFLEEAVLIGSVPHVSNPISQLLDRLLLAVRTRLQYQQSFLAADKSQADQWEVMGEFTAAILEDGGRDAQDRKLNEVSKIQYYGRLTVKVSSGPNGCQTARRGCVQSNDTCGYDRL
ncbi:hypothetical protein PHMEG_00025342, partial [Phytophthora megakarya]